MFKKLLLASTIITIGTFPAWAQESTEPTPLPAPAEQIAPDLQAPDAQAPEAQAPTDQAPADQATPSTGAIGEIAPDADAPVTPPPSDAVIPLQAADEVRANALIGMNVYNTEGDKVGEVKDILFDESGQATGMVLSVGGVLGLGAKSVGLNWSEVDVQPQADMVKVHYSKEQLEAAPDFKTQEAQQAEDEAARIELEQPAANGTVPLTAPASTE